MKRERLTMSTDQSIHTNSAASQSAPCSDHEQCLELEELKVDQASALFHISGELSGKRTDRNSAPLKINSLAVQRGLFSFFTSWVCGLQFIPRAPSHTESNPTGQ